MARQDFISCSHKLCPVSIPSCAERFADILGPDFAILALKIRENSENFLNFHEIHENLDFGLRLSDTEILVPVVGYSCTEMFAVHPRQHLDTHVCDKDQHITCIVVRVTRMGKPNNILGSSPRHYSAQELHSGSAPECCHFHVTPKQSVPRLPVPIPVLSVALRF